MRIFIGGLLAALITAAPATAQTVIETFDVADARAWAEASGAALKKTSFGEADNEAPFAFDLDWDKGNLPATFQGWDCEGQGQALRCRNFVIEAFFTFDTEAEARRWEQTLDLNWIADTVIEERRLLIWRQGFADGATPAHMIKTFNVFREVAYTAADIVYAKEDPAAQAPARSGKAE